MGLDNPLRNRQAQTHAPLLERDGWLEQGAPRLLAQARTQWVPINPETAKPIRVPPEVRERFSI